ncbi:MAG TPA: hypothetical protein VLS94_00145, partial [Fusibacter sp.]|nr:hypothetical protein [Fusibacter sp.]
FKSPIYHNLERTTETILAAVVMLIPLDVTEIQIDIMSQLSKALVEEDTFIDKIKRASESELKQFIKSILHNWLSKNMKTGGLV